MEEDEEGEDGLALAHGIHLWRRIDRRPISRAGAWPDPAATAFMKLDQPALLSAYQQINDRCLYSEASWLLDFITSNQLVKGAIQRTAPGFNLEAARLAFHQKQYRRAAAMLEGANDGVSLFLKLYSLMIAIELNSQARKNGEGLDFVSTGSSDELVQLQRNCKAAILAHPQDSFLLVLMSMINEGLDMDSISVNDPLIAALRLEPLNWAAWSRLRVTDESQLSSLSLPTTSPFHPFFLIKTRLSLNKDVAQNVSRLQRKYSSDKFLHFALAVNSANLRDFEVSRKLFSELFQAYPWTVEYAGVYASVLFVLGKSAELSFLARRCVGINRFSAETCLVLGNMWSLAGRHEQAVASFRRALRLDPSLPSAWVLVGHEYIELRNPSAAIACYLRATKVSPSDYRAWFGLGQVYDLLGSPAQAADYYRRAADLCPEDGRLWAALGAVFEAEEMLDHALEAYDRASVCIPVDRIVFHRLGRISLALGLHEPSLQAFYRYLGGSTGLDRVPIDGDDTASALLEVARAWMEGAGNREDAAAILRSLSALNSKEGKEALRLHTAYST